MKRLERRRPRRHTAVATTALVVTAAAVVALIALLMMRQAADRRQAEAEGAAYQAPSPTAPAYRIVSVLADELTAAPDGTDQDAAWPALLGEAIDARVFVVDSGGSYTRPATPGGATFVNGAGSVAPRADVVVVFGGRDDAGASTKALREDAARVYAAATATAPDARLVVVGPVTAPEAASPAVLAVRDTLRAQVRRTHAAFVDPIADGWFDGHDDEFRQNGELTAAGERRMAAYVGSALANLVK